MDLGVLRGLACFDFFRVVDGRPLFLEDHSERLRRSCELLGLNAALTEPQQLRVWLARVLETNNAKVGTWGVRVLVTGGASTDGWTHDTTADAAVLMVHQMSDLRRALEPAGRLLSCLHERTRPHLKSTDYGYALAQQRRLLEAGCCELMLCDRDGRVSECSRSSLFFVDARGELHTAPHEAVLLGVTRKRVLELCAANGIETHVRPIGRDELDVFAGCFITSTSKVILPIEAIDGKLLYRNGPPEVVVRLFRLLLEHIDLCVEQMK
jgi:D-alanine transaminase/branched-chain amino acid aminotransferase